MTQADPGSPWLVWTARAVWFVALLLAFGTIWLGTQVPITIGPLADEGIPAFLAAGVLVGMGYATAGVLLARQRPRHTIAWVLLAAGGAFVTLFATFVLGSRLGSVDARASEWVALIGTVLWWPAVLLAGPVLALLFPDGHLPSPRWRTVTALVIAALVVYLALLVLRPGPIGTDLPNNPLGVPIVPTVVYDLLDLLFVPLIILAPLVLAAVAVVTRFRRAVGEPRQQLKWFASAVIAWAAIFAASLLAPGLGAGVVSFGTLLLVPAAILVAISRYRLYEIDTLINRTLVYLPVIGIVAGIYAALVVSLQRIFVSWAGDESDAAAVISALVLAAIFHPIRKSVEGVVDRLLGPAKGRAEPASPQPWDDERFDAAVERVVIRVLANRADATGPSGPS